MDLYLHHDGRLAFLRWHEASEQFLYCTSAITSFVDIAGEAHEWDWWCSMSREERQELEKRRMKEKDPIMYAACYKENHGLE